MPVSKSDTYSLWMMRIFGLAIIVILLVIYSSSSTYTYTTPYQGRKYITDDIAGAYSNKEQEIPFLPTPATQLRHIDQQTVSNKWTDPPIIINYKMQPVSVLAKTPGNRIWTDVHNNSKVSFWQMPYDNDGFMPLGDTWNVANDDSGYNAPESGTVMLIKPSKLLRNPIGYGQTNENDYGYPYQWGDQGSGAANSDTAVWRPLCPPGHIAIGDVLSPYGTRNAPDIKKMICVPTECVAKQGNMGGQTNLIHSLRDGGSDRSVSFHRATGVKDGLTFGNYFRTLRESGNVRDGTNVADWHPQLVPVNNETCMWIPSV